MNNNTYEVIKIDENSWRIEDSQVRVFLFIGANRAILVDSGFGTGNIKEAVLKITKLPIMLVNTHADGDHIGCNELFDTAHMHPSEFALYYESVPPTAKTSPLRDGAVIDIGSRKFEIIHIPGHTPGSIALLDRDNKLLIPGDSISDSPIFMFGKQRSLAAYIDSLTRLSELCGDFDTIYPSHGAFPIKSDVVDVILKGAARLTAGELEGQTPPFDLPAQLYTYGDAKFLY